MFEEKTKKNIVCFGGGSGLPELLRGLKMFGFYHITAVVAMSDSGGASGDMMRGYQLSLPPGDLLRCIQALSDLSPEVLKFLSMRFEKLPETPTSGHLIFQAMEHMYSAKNIVEAILILQEQLKIEGRSLPVTADPTKIVATFEDGWECEGEEEIDRYMNEKSAIKDIRLRLARSHGKASVEIPERVQRAIMGADYICIGPGSFYTSILPTLMPGGVTAAITSSRAPIIYITNLLTEGVGMRHMTLKSCLSIVEQYTERPIDYIVVNTQELTSEALKVYAAQNKHPLVIDDELKKDSRLLCGHLWMSDTEKARRETDPHAIRHDPRRLAGMIFAITHCHT